MIGIKDRFDGVNRMQRGLRTQKASIIRALRNAILGLPENQNITVLSKKPRCFVMNFSDLSSRDWSPEYYNFEKQYRAICREIRHKKFEDVIPFLKDILKNGAMKKTELHYWYVGHDASPIHRQTVKVNIHPTVIQNIKNLL
jgi:hypothetical protein